MTQAKFAEDMQNQLSRDFVIVHFELSKEKAIERIMDRAKKEGRADDNEESIKTRLGAFEQETLPAIKYFAEK
jgi:adenylate kinase